MTATLLDLAALVALAAVAGWAMRRLGQPAVVGEIGVGILLGPTVLSAHAREQLLPASALPVLNGIGTLGLVAFMFLVGLECGTPGVGGPGGTGASARRIAVLTGVAMGLPFLLGTGFGVLQRGSAPAGEQPAFVLFLGVALAITAFPVLARILLERGVHRTELGRRVLAVAGASDAVGWLLLAVVIALAGHPSWALAGLPAYLAALVLARPVLRRLLAGPPAGLGAVLAVGLLGSAAATAAMGLHPLFGAFAFGLAVPGRGAVPERLRGSVEPIVSTVALPLYFVLTGMQVDLRGFGWSTLQLLAAVVALAAVGKIGGGYLGARLTGSPRIQALRTGVLLNTRGLTELVVLAVGRDLGLLDGRLFAVFVLMALLTTAATGPLLDLVDRWAQRSADATAPTDGRIDRGSPVPSPREPAYPEGGRP